VLKPDDYFPNKVAVQFTVNSPGKVWIDDVRLVQQKTSDQNPYCLMVKMLEIRKVHPSKTATGAVQRKSQKPFRLLTISLK